VVRTLGKIGREGLHVSAPQPAPLDEYLVLQTFLMDFDRHFLQCSEDARLMWRSFVVEFWYAYFRIHLQML